MQPDLGLVWKFKNIEVFQEFHVKNILVKLQHNGGKFWGVIKFTRYIFKKKKKKIIFLSVFIVWIIFTIHAKGDKGAADISNQSGFFYASLADHRLISNARHSYIVNGMTSLIKMRGNFLTHLSICVCRPNVLWSGLPACAPFPQCTDHHISNT